jgi:hypothetical protein
MFYILMFISLFTPRLVLFIILLVTNWFSMSYKTVIWPLLGFLFMPYTTLIYMLAMINNNHQVSGWWLIALIIAVIFDLGGQGGYIGCVRC